MSINIRFPNIPNADPSTQLVYFRKYLHQLVEQLNVALDAVGDTSSGKTALPAPSKVEKEKEAQNTFNSVKSLIIKSADIVNAYYEEINKRLSGVYVAESDFGTYTQQTDMAIRENADGIDRLFSNLQEITDTLGEVVSVVDVKAYINAGVIEEKNGIPVYGLEIGQTNTVDGKEVFNKYARFTSEKLSFYDKNDNEVAYVSDKKLYILSVEITGSFIHGGFTDRVLPDRSVVTKWRR